MAVLVSCRCRMKVFALFIVVAAVAPACMPITLPPPGQLRAAPECHAWIENAGGGTSLAALVEKEHAYRIDGFREEISHWDKGDFVVTSQFLPQLVAEYVAPDELHMKSSQGRALETLRLTDGTTRLGAEIIAYGTTCSKRDAALAVASVYQMLHPFSARER
jgi:hypothetical protein